MLAPLPSERYTLWASQSVLAAFFEDPVLAHHLPISPGPAQTSPPMGLRKKKPQFHSPYPFHQFWILGQTVLNPVVTQAIQAVSENGVWVSPPELDLIQNRSFTSPEHLGGRDLYVLSLYTLSLYDFIIDAQ